MLYVVSPQPQIPILLLFFRPKIVTLPAREQQREARRESKVRATCFATSRRSPEAAFFPYDYHLVRCARFPRLRKP